MDTVRESIQRCEGAAAFDAAGLSNAYALNLVSSQGESYLMPWVTRIDRLIQDLENPLHCCVWIALTTCVLNWARYLKADGPVNPESVSSMIAKWIRQRLAWFLFPLACLPATAWAQIGNATPEGKPVFDVHLVVLTARAEAVERTSDARLREEVEILNRYFVGANDERPVVFRYKSHTRLPDLHDSPCREFMALGDASAEYDPRRWAGLFNACRDPRVVDPQAINFYVADTYSTEKGYRERDSYGKNNRNRPFIVLDWERLGHRSQSPEEHEMGHAFGLSHVCAPGADLNTSTNIMASHKCGLGSGGRRNLGFDAEQLNIIRTKAQAIARRLQEN